MAIGYNGQVSTFISLLKFVIVLSVRLKANGIDTICLFSIMIANVGLHLIISDTFTLLIVSLSTVSVVDKVEGRIFRKVAWSSGYKKTKENLLRKSLIFKKFNVLL